MTHTPEGPRPGGDADGDALETLLRAARPGETAPLDEARAREIFARALALSGAAEEIPQERKERPWWLPRFPQLTLPTWGAAGLAATAACGIAAGALLLRPRPAAVTPKAPVFGGAIARIDNKPVQPIIAPEIIQPVQTPASSVVEKPRQQQQQRRVHRRRHANPIEQRIVPEVKPRFGSAPDMLVAWKDTDSDLLVVASGTSVPVSDQADIVGDPADENTGAVALGPEDETLTVAVRENAPDDLPGRAEAAAAREVPVGPAGPTGPTGDTEGAEGPAGPSSSSGVTTVALTPTPQRTILVWAQASVATNEQPSLVLTQIRVEIR